MPRLPANDRVWIEGHEREAWAINWSSKGLCVMTEGDLELQARVRVELPDRYTRCEATVVWTQAFPDGMLAGLRFDDVERSVSALVETSL